VENENNGCKEFLIKKKKEPLISIVVPVYNAEKYLRECIESVLNQDFSDYELILVNDGSKDKSGDICDEYKKRDPRVVVIHKQNEGPITARKIGVEKATGIYLMSLDSDDYYEQGLLKHISMILEQYDTEAIIFNEIRFDENGYKKHKCLLKKGLYYGESIKKIRDSLILNDRDKIAIPYGICMKVFLRSLYINFQKTLPKELYKGEDLAVTVPLLEACKSVYVSDIYGYYYRNNPESLMNSFYSNELTQIKILADYLTSKMSIFYESRIDTYVVLHLFDYLDRLMTIDKRYSTYRREYKNIQNGELMLRVKRARSRSTRFNEKVLFFLFRHRLFTLLWILRKIKKRKPIS